MDASSSFGDSLHMGGFRSGAAQRSHNASGKKEKQRGLGAGLVLSRMN